MAGPKKRIPAQPSGEAGRKRSRGRRGGRDAREVERGDRIDPRLDERMPDSTAREHPDGSAPPLERKTGYRNTDERS